MPEQLSGRRVVTRLLVYEGPADWVDITLEKSLPEGVTVIGGDRRITVVQLSGAGSVRQLLREDRTPMPVEAPEPVRVPEPEIDPLAHTWLSCGEHGVRLLNGDAYRAQLREPGGWKCPVEGCGKPAYPERRPSEAP